MVHRREQGDRAFVIEWRPQLGFGVSEIRTDDPYGESLPDEFFRDGQRALDRTIELLVPRAGEPDGLHLRSTAHSLRNVFAAIRSSGEHILKASPSARKEVETIIDATSAGDTLAQELSSPHVSSTPRAFDVNAHIQRQKSLLEGLLGAGRIDLKLELASNALEIVENEQELTHALLNLVLNSRDAMPSGGTLTIATAATARDVLVAVSDTGSGIPREIGSRVFLPFFTTKERGTGLGLAVVDRFARNLGGKVEFESSSSGTTFRLTLPAAHADERAATRAILIVDDDDFVRGSLARALLEEGFDVLTAAHPKEALDTLKARPDVDVVVLDVRLPGVTGFQLAETFEAQNLAVNVIYMSGSAEARVQADVRSRPFLAKPFATEELLRTVKRAGRAA